MPSAAGAFELKAITYKSTSISSTPGFLTFSNEARPAVLLYTPDCGHAA